MVVDGLTGKVIGDIPDTPRVHGIGLAKKSNHGFTTNGGDSTVTMFDLKTLAVIKRLPVSAGGLDGIMYDDSTNRIILTNHSKPGRATAIDARRKDYFSGPDNAQSLPGGAGIWSGTRRRNGAGTWRVSSKGSAHRCAVHYHKSLREARRSECGT